MKRQNKRRLVSLALCSALLAGVVVMPVNSNAQTFDGTGKAKTSGTASVEADPDNSVIGTMDVDIKAKTIGSDIKYSITVDPGDMEFTYSYGDSWNTTSHSYSGGSVGWDPSNLDGENNKITVTNDSNYPVKASFKVKSEDELLAAFNSDPSDTDGVRGYFNTNNTAFVTNPGTSSAAVTQLIAKATDDSNKTGSLSLEMNASALTTGYYYKKGSSSSKPGAADATGDMYFALAGVPDKTIATQATVGQITITIKPETGVTKVNLP